MAGRRDRKMKVDSDSASLRRKLWGSVRRACDHYRMGVGYSRKRRYFEALQEFQKALVQNPRTFQVFKDRAHVYEQLGDTSSAAADFETYLSFSPCDIEVLDKLILYFTGEEMHLKAGYYVEQRAGVEKKKDIRRELLTLAAKVYMKGNEYEEAKRVYHMLLRDDAYNPLIFKSLKMIYHRTGNRRKWKACREVLQLNNQITSGEVVTDSIGLFRVSHPLTSELYERMMHPEERSFRKYFSWMMPLIKMMEQPTSPEIIKGSSSAEDEPFYPLYKECCQYLNMDPPELLRYTGSVSFRFLADPADKGASYRLIYHDRFLRGLSDQELVFLFLTQLSLIRSNMIPLLNLSLSDVVKVLLETASFLFGIMMFLETAPLGKAAKLLGRFIVSKQLIDKVTEFQGKLKKFKVVDRSPQEMQMLLKSSIDSMPENLKNDTGEERKSFLNQKFLESMLSGVYYSADRVAYYFTRSLITGTKSLVKLLDKESTLERVEKFGIAPFVKDSKNSLLKNRLGELYFFSVDSDLFDEQGQAGDDSVV